MSQNPVRENKNCLNCDNPYVEERFCPKCGQENVESHQSFKSLAFHFFEDFTHYDNAFWKTIKYLLFHPARLTKEYLSGKRKSFVPPVKLYIFISFITFLLPSLLPEFAEENGSGDIIQSSTEQVDLKKDSIIKTERRFSVFDSGEFSSVKQLDSVQNSLSKKKKITPLSYWLIKKRLENAKTKYNDESFREIYFHSVPKALFVYLPVFGFWLWVFHGKKRWYFYDHAIFTLHYFAFILLLLTLSVTLFERLLEYIPIPMVYDILSNVNGFLTCSWIIVYFYMAHKRMYQESGIISFLKTSLLLFINITLLLLLMLALAFYYLIYM